MLAFNKTIGTGMRIGLALISFSVLAAGFWFLQGRNHSEPAIDKNAATLILEGGDERGGSPVRRGNLGGFSAKRGDSLGEVNSKSVYLAIPSYKTIREEKVRRGSARWAQLMREATAAYNEALNQASRGANCVLIVEKGSAKRIPEIPAGYPVQDITQACIAAL